MKGIFLALALLSAAPLAGCAAIPTPVGLASKTKVDEQVIVTAEQAYKAFRLAVTVGVQANIIHGPRAEELADIDNNLYEALQAMETAYGAGNAANFLVAYTKFNQFLAQANALTGGKD